MKKKYYKRKEILYMGANPIKDWEKKVYKQAKELYHRKGINVRKYVVEFSQPCSIGGLTVTFTHIKDVRYDYVGFLGIATCKQCEEEHEKLFGHT